MVYDLGVRMKPGMSESQFINVLSKLDAVFDLIMIMEHFDESLGLLQTLLCWSSQDLAYQTVNEKRSKSQEKQTLSEKAQSELKTLLKYEYLLYDFFRQKFKRKVQNQRDSKTRVNTLRRVKVATRDLCQIVTKTNHGIHCPGAPLKKKPFCPCYPFNMYSYCKCFNVNGIILAGIAKCIQDQRLGLPWQSKTLSNYLVEQ